MQQGFLDSLSRVLKKNGTIVLSTDEIKMKSWILEQFHVRADFEWQIDDLNETFKAAIFYHMKSFNSGEPQKVSKKFLKK